MKHTFVIFRSRGRVAITKPWISCEYANSDNRAGSELDTLFGRHFSHVRVRSNEHKVCLKTRVPTGNCWGPKSRRVFRFNWQTRRVCYTGFVSGGSIFSVQRVKQIFDSMVMSVNGRKRPFNHSYPATSAKRKQRRLWRGRRPGPDYGHSDDDPSRSKAPYTRECQPSVCERSAAAAPEGRPGRPPSGRAGRVLVRGEKHVRNIARHGRPTPIL